jgi:nitrate reductase beta subunit
MKKIIIILLIIFIYGCNNKNLYTYKSGNYTEDLKFEIVNIRKVLKYPDRYNEKNISIKGFHRSGFEIGAIFKNKRSALNSDGANAIWLHFDSLSEKDYYALFNYDRRNVIIKGQYIKGKKGHLGIYNGEIKVDYLEIK